MKQSNTLTSRFPDSQTFDTGETWPWSSTHWTSGLVELDRVLSIVPPCSTKYKDPLVPLPSCLTLSPVIRLGLWNPRKKERKKVFHSIWIPPCPCSTCSTYLNLFQPVPINCTTCFIPHFEKIFLNKTISSKRCRAEERGRVNFCRLLLTQIPDFSTPPFRVLPALDHFSIYDPPNYDDCVTHGVSSQPPPLTRNWNFPQKNIDNRDQTPEHMGILRFI